MLEITVPQQRSGIFFSVVSWHVKVVFLAVMFTECRTQIFLHFCHFMFNFKRNMWSRIGRYVSSWHVICTWKCVLNTNSVASNPLSLTPCNKAVCGEASPQIKMSFAQVHWNPVQALFIKPAALQLSAEQCSWWFRASGAAGVWCHKTRKCQWLLTLCQSRLGFKGCSLLQLMFGNRRKT